MFFLQMSGFPGSGKSTLSREIAKLTGAIVIDHDVVKSALLESGEVDSIDAKVAGKISYDIEWALIDLHLSQGHDVILDSPCFYTEMVEMGLRLSKKHRAKYKYVECYLNNMHEINKRLKKRKRMMTQIQHVESEVLFKEWIENSKKPVDSQCLAINSGQPLESYIDEVIAYVNS